MNRPSTPPTKRSNAVQSSLSSFFAAPKQSTHRLSSPQSTPPTKSPSITPPKPMVQLHLANLGRSTRTTIHCTTCQMHYNKIDPNDQKLHKTHHDAILNGPSFPPSTAPIASRPLPASPLAKLGDLVVISRTSTRELQKRALALLDMVDTAIGAPSNPLRAAKLFAAGGKVYLLVSSRRIVSVVAAERLEYAHRRIPLSPGTGGVETSRTDRERAVIGISRMWTCVAQRGRGVCAALLDEVAAGFVWGMDCRAGAVVGGRGKRDCVAFSTPSESGMAVARKWTGKEDFLVYDD
jgi:ESCO1/2 acetyl-transferase/zinc-finger of acetyl-transferase ESCO